MKNIFSNISSSKRSFRYGSRLKPFRDWMVLLAVFVILLLGSLAWNLWIFSQVTKGHQVGVATSTPASEIHLDSVTTLFASRTEEQEKYLDEYRFIDPSQ